MCYSAESAFPGFCRGATDLRGWRGLLANKEINTGLLTRWSSIHTQWRIAPSVGYLPATLGLLMKVKLVFPTNANQREGEVRRPMLAYLHRNLARSVGLAARFAAGCLANLAVPIRAVDVFICLWLEARHCAVLGQCSPRLERHCDSD